MQEFFKSTPIDHLTDHPLNRLPEDPLMLNHDGIISLPRKLNQQIKNILQFIPIFYADILINVLSFEAMPLNDL